MPADVPTGRVNVLIARQAVRHGCCTYRARPQHFIRAAVRVLDTYMLCPAYSHARPTPLRPSRVLS